MKGIAYERKQIAVCKRIVLVFSNFKYSHYQGYKRIPPAVVQ